MSGSVVLVTEADADKIEHYVALAQLFGDPNAKDDARVKAAQELSEGFETILASPHYSSFIETSIPIFLKFLQAGEAYFVAEYHAQQGRKTILELLHRIPCNEHIRPHVRSILNIMFKLLEIDNEENVIICLRIIIELHKQFRPPFSPEVQQFLNFVKNVYKDLPGHMDKIFDPKPQNKVKDISEINLGVVLDDIYAVTSFQSEKKSADGSTFSYNVLPKARNSLKVLQELPIIVVLMYQIYKNNVQQEVAEFIPIVMLTITLQPNILQRNNPNFNKEVLVEFMGAQVKTLSFLAYIIKLYQDLVVQHSNLLVTGLINLLGLCPMEVAYLRRELFIAARHIMATDLRFKFVPYMDKLFDEEILLGRGWTVNETMRPLAYSTLADLVHHVRQHLSLCDLNRAVMFFSCHVHDESLPLSIQTMSCKLLFNLVESIRLKSESEGGNGREILMRMLDVLVYKFKVIAQVHIPFFLETNKELAANPPAPIKPEPVEQTADELFAKQLATEEKPKEESRRFGFPLAPMQNYSFTECRTLVKTVVCAVKTISWGIASCKNANQESVPNQPATYKQFTAKETEVYLRLIRWGLKAVDIYAINGPTVNAQGQQTYIPQRPINTQGVRSKEEKEVLEHFAGAFTLLNNYSFRELFAVSIDTLVQRIHENNALQVVANNLLANPTTSAVFATILVEYLLQKMPEMGDDVEKSNLYLRLFKLVFGSVSLFSSENEQMLRPHLKDIVNRSMELALNAKDPYNYFLLLRALFRSIGGGSHDLLYQEFLPLLPSLLQGLNSLQSGLHKQHMKDLFVELCLTVPVRLSSLLPYLPMLMDPLVSALNGSTTLISQGLRTLELCVDNLQPEFLYEHIQPVRAELMQALWRTLRSANDSTAVVAFRILGKFGGSNRKMLVEPQKLEFTDKTILGQCLTLHFQDHKTTISLPIDKILEVALQTLRSLNPSLDLFYKKQAWELVKAFIMSSSIVEDDRFIPNKIILHGKMSEGEVGPSSLAQRPVFTDEKCRSTLTMGIAGIFIAVCVKELKREAYIFMIPFIRHVALIIVSQQTGPFMGRMQNMDPYVLFDAMAQVLAHEERDMKRPVLVGLSILMNCIINIVRSKDRACSLPMIEYLTEKMCNLCYERAWYTKMGGCQAISFFLENMSLRWILSHQFTMVKAMYFVLTDLTGEVSAGALDIARENLAKLIRICATCSEDNLHGLKIKSLHDMTLEFVKQLTSPITNIRNQSMRGLELLAEHQSKTVSAVMEPHRDVLMDMVPPKKHLIRHQSIQSQLGLLDGNTFCLSLRPRLFTLDLNTIEHRNFVSELTALCEADDQALAKLPCYKNVTNLTPVKMAIMRVVARVARLNEAGPLTKEKIVSLFVKGMASGNTDLMNCAFECLQKFMEEHTVEVEMQTNALRPILHALTNMRTVTIPILTQLSFLYQLFPGLYTDKVWEQLLQILRKCLELALVAHSKAPARTGVHELKLAVAVLSLFPLLPPSNTRFLEPMVKLCLQAEKALLLGKGCPLRQPLMKFLLRQPQEYLDLVFAMPYLNLAEWNRFFIYFLQQDDADKLRQCLVTKPARLIYCLNIKSNPVIPAVPPHVLNNSSAASTATPPSTPTSTGSSTPTSSASTPGPPTFTTTEQNDIQYLAVKAMTVLSEFDEDWILGVGPNRGEVVKALRSLWESNDYQASCNTHICCLPSLATQNAQNAQNATAAPSPAPAPEPSPAPSEDSSAGAAGSNGTPAKPAVQTPTVTAAAWSRLQVQTWKEPQMIAKLLLSYYRKNPSDIDMLFKLLLAFCGKSISQFQFLKDFLEKTVTKYSVLWKRTAFFQFVAIFQEREYPEELKAKIIQYILIPCMAYCFEKGQGDELIGSEPMPDKDSSDNIVSVFLSKVIDPENPNAMPDSVRILLCQLSCLLVEQASAHIHDASNKKQGNKLRRLMTFAWPCLLSKTCVDSSTKYYGHLLLSHIIAKFAIHKRIVLQVFHSLLKASALEAKNVVKQALEIITPALPLRMEDGNTMLIHWTKKILLEEGHSLSQLMHLLQLIVRHWRVYYPVRHMLVAHMVSAIQRLGFTPTSTFEHRKLAVEMAEVVIKWELERIRNEDDSSIPLEKKIKTTPSPLINTTKALEKTHTDSVLNFLLRLACQVNEPNPAAGSTGEILSKRCVSLVKTVLKPDVWSDCDLKLSWFDKLFATIDSPQVNNPNICTALELMTFIIGILPKEYVLEHMKVLQKGISACMTCQNSRVIRAVHTFMTKLMSVFPTEFPTSNNSASTMQKYEELDTLYTCVSKVVYDGLSNYDKVANANPQSLLGALMMLKSACTNNPCYIDRIITPFMKVLQRLAREHLNPASADATLATELLVLSLDLVKNRVGVMGVEMRKAFIGTVLVGLIEKSTDTKVMQGIIKMLEEWVRNKNPIVINQGPSLREKSILLVKMMQNVEKRFSGDNELIGLFLELINFIYRDEHLKVGELNAKLEPAFLSGLRCTQPLIRAKFFQVFDASIRRRLHDRIMYILCSQNWEAMGPHYWIKQCTELLLSTVIDADVELTPREAIIPGIAHNMHSAETYQRETFLKIDPDMKVEPYDYEVAFIQQLENDVENLEKVDETDEATVVKVIARMEDAFLKEGWCDPSHPVINVKMILLKETDFGHTISELRLSTFIQSVIQLIHLDTNLAEKVWGTFFPRAWRIFSEKQQMAIANDIVPFLCSGVHVLQQTCYPSTMNTFVEALCSCVPAVTIKPAVLFYLGRTHNLWHRMALLLEQMALDNGMTPQLKTKKDVAGDCYDFEPSAPPTTNPSQPSLQQQEILDALSELYSMLKEDDLWAGMWQRKARYPETNIGIAFEMQGFYEKAQGAYELGMSKAKTDFANSSASMAVFSELKLWEEHWIRCSKELNQWDIVQEYSSCKTASNPMVVIESAWRVPNWALMKESLAQVEVTCPKDQAWKVHLLRGYVAICSSEDQDLAKVDRYVEGAQALCIKEWRRLPALISNVHISVLQAAQMIVELHEATQIHQGLIQGRTNSLHDMKSVVKTWRNRLPCISDDLSHWSDIFTWRQQHYQFIANHFDGQNDQGGNQTMLGVHASAQAICHFGKIARKHNLTSVCLESLSKIYTIPSVPIVDCFQKIKQQVKCYIQQAQVLGRNELQEALEIVESTNLKYFSKEMTCEFFALKGLLLSQIGRSEDANKAFSAACQMHDALSKSWGFWGDYLETTFTRDARQIHLGISAVTAFMNSCRHQNEAKARKYIAKILWLLIYDDEKGTLADAVDKFALGVPPIQWLPWVPQLLTSLVRHDGKMVINLLNQVGRMYPQAVYFPIRTLYLTLKIEQREKTRHAELAAAAAAGSILTSATPVSVNMNPVITNPEMAAAAAANASQQLQLSQSLHQYQVQLQQLQMQNLTPLQLQQQTQHIQQQLQQIQQQQHLLQQHQQNLQNHQKLQNQMQYGQQPTHNFPIPQPKIEPGTEHVPSSQSPSPAPGSSLHNPSNTSSGSVNSPNQPPAPPQPETQAIKATPSMWRCSRIMHMQRDLHPTVLSSLEGIVDQIIWFRENWYEEVHRQLKIGLAKCHAIAFENRSLVMEACITPQLQNYVKKLVSTFGHVFASSTAGATTSALPSSTSMGAPSTPTSGVPSAAATMQSTSGTPTIEALLRRTTTNQDPSFQHMKVQFSMDFDNSIPGADKLHNLILKLRKWIKILEAKTRMFPKTFLMEDRFRFLQNFSSQIAEIELPGEFLIPKHAHYYVKIARFQPRIEVVQKHNTSSRRIFIRGHNGKIYPYLIVNDSGLSDQRREERVMQMTRMLNHYLSRQKVTAKRNLRFTVPKVVAVSPQMRLVEDNPSSLSLLDIFKVSCSRRTVEFDSPIIRYYEKIAAIQQTRGAQVSHQVLREILRDIQSNIVPRTMMKEWALNTFNGPSDYWVFRKIFALQLCLWAFAEYAFHLTRLNPEMMYLHKDSGMINISYFKFDIDDGTGELDSNRPVPFRLTPNIAEFLTPFGVQGPIVSAMISIARCLVYPNYKMPAILRAILRDEMISWIKKKQEDRDIPAGSRESGANNETDAETVINMVTKSVNAIMHRMQMLSTFDGSESKVSCLVAAANSHDNLCRMDPAWHPWL